jgi:hypothetical protein
MEDCWDLDRVSDKCEYVTDHCGWLWQFYFCDLGASLYGLIPLVGSSQAVFLGGLIYMLGHTAAEYFAPALADIAERLKISPTLAISA